MNINLLENNKADNSYFTDSYIQVLEDHLSTIRNNPENRIADVDNKLNYKYEGDLYGLLTVLNVEKKYHYITGRLNNVENSTDYKGDMTSLLIPSPDLLESLKQANQTKVV